MAGVLAYAAGAVAALVGGWWLMAHGKPNMLDCSTEFSAANHGGRRLMANVKWIVLHSTEGDTAKGAAMWFANPASGGSTQLVVDDSSCYRTLPDDVVPYGAPGANEQGLHLEMAGYGGVHGPQRLPPWTRAQWLAHDAMLRRAAAHVAEWGAAYRIPLRYVDAAGLRRGDHGVTTHLQVTQAFSGGKGHVDPGVAFPLDVLLRYAGGEPPLA